MAYKEVTTVGPVEWARIFEDNRDMTGYEGRYEDCNGAYTIQQILTKEEMEKLKKTGSQKKPKQGRLMDGEIVVQFERKHEVYNKNGDLIEKAGGPPKVLGPTGKRWDPDVDGLIGNGSIAQVTNLVSSFKGADGKTIARTTLTKVRIIDLVPYDKPDEEDMEDEVENELEDEIPF